VFDSNCYPIRNTDFHLNSDGEVGTAAHSIQSMKMVSVDTAGFNLQVHTFVILCKIAPVSIFFIESYKSRNSDSAGDGFGRSECNGRKRNMALENQ
jgi:hypothetical protein